MTAPPPRPPILNTYTSLLSTLTSFLTVSIHTLLYSRALYPSSTFISARAYNFPVRQNRHPKVCAWINDAVASVEKEMAAGRVEKISFVVYDIGGGEAQGRKDAKVREKWVFDVGAWPVIQRSDRFVEFESRADEPTDRGRVQMVDIEEQLRGTVRRLAYTAEKMEPLPEGCTYTLVVELREEAEPMIGHPQAWIAAEPGVQRRGAERGKVMEGKRSIPVRAVEAGAFVMETWVELAG